MADPCVLEVLIEIRNALWDRNEAIEPVGSPAYVRRLRDQAAVTALEAMLSGVDLEQALSTNRAVDGGLSAKTAIALAAGEYADDLIRALGYDPPGEPGKEG